MNEQAEGFIELRNGMNSGRNPLLLADTQCSRAINVSFRGGQAGTRPAYVKVPVSIPAGIFRGCGRWSLEQSDRLVFVIDYTLYTLDLSTLELREHAAFASDGTQCHFVQADRYMIVQDGVNAPAVLEDVGGIPQLTASPVTLPAGEMGVYAHGRIHMVPLIVPNTDVSGRPYLISGDILQPLDPSTVLLATETEYLSEGGAHALPAEMGYVGGLGVLRNAHTGTGLGSVVALARNGVCAFDFSISRDLWKDQALSQVLFYGPGCRSPWSVVSINDDLAYRGLDGIRALRYAQSQVAASSGSLSNTPLSQEVDDFLGGDTEWLSWASMAVNDNRLFCTCGDTDQGNFKGLVVWDLGSAYYNGVQGTGIYDGLWTGQEMGQVLSALANYVPRLFFFGISNELFYLDDDALYDPENTPVEARIETKAYGFGDYVTTKRLEYAELWLSDVPITTEVKVYYRPHGYPLWKLLGTRTVTIPDGSLPQSVNRLRFTLDYSEQNCNPITNEPLYVAPVFQFAIQWTGRATIERFRAVCQPLQEQPPYPEDGAGAVLAASELAGEEFDDFSYAFARSSQ